MGNIAIIAQISVTRISIISTAAKILFCNPNCIGENIKLKIRLSIKGRTTINPICFCKAKTKTFPKDTAIKIYKKVQTGPNKYDGGAQDGFIKFEYQLKVLFIFIFYHNIQKNTPVYLSANRSIF
jgi:hypothetical protein